MAQSSGGRLIVVYVNETSRAALAADLANLEDEGQQAVHRRSRP
jgi:hypothetical protein